MKRWTVPLSLVLLSCATASCSKSDELTPPVSVTASTSGKICESIRSGLPESPFVKVVALGECEEQKTLNGGRLLWLEMSDLSKLNPGITRENLKFAMVAVSVSLASFGFRSAKESPSDFEQLYFSFRDDDGSHFEINPSDMQKFLPQKELPQDKWDKLIEKELALLIPKITIQTSK